MGGLNTALNIGIQGLEASQAALDAASNNISNANAAGYTREVPEFSSVQLTLTGNVASGGGVTLDSLQSIRDELLNLQINQQTSAQGSADTVSSNLAQIQGTFSSSSGADIASQLAAFSNSLSQVSANPSSSAAQQAVVTSGQNLANAFNSTASALTSVQTAADSQVTESVSEINSLTSQISQLNQQVAQLQQSGHDGGALEDQRDHLVNQLSQITSVQVIQSGSSETITTGNGTALVSGSESFSLQTATGSDGFQHVLDSNGKDITTSLTGGKIGGAIQVRDQTIPSFSSQLNTLATQLAKAFNDAQAYGYDAKGNQGQAFFTLPANPAGAAAGISVASNATVAASSDKYNASGSDGNVPRLLLALTKPLPSGDTPAGAYASLVYQVGAAESDANTQSSAIGQNLQQLQNQQSSVSGVSVDEETTNLLRFQQSYEAAARIVSTVQQLSTVTLDMGTSGGY